jgi:hypothetical protein
MKFSSCLLVAHGAARWASAWVYWSHLELEQPHCCRAGPSLISRYRGGFFIHGGENWGSAGCIDLTYGMASFAKVIEPMSNCHIPVVVDYNGTTRVPAPS